MKRILFLSPNEEITQAYLANNQFVSQISVCTNLQYQELPAVIKEFEDIGGQIIISRGAMAQKAKLLSKIPIISIKVGTEDILQAFEKHRNTKKTIGVIGDTSVIEKCVWIANYLDIKIDVVETNNIKITELFNVIDNKIKNHNIESFIGDTHVLNLMNKQTLDIDYTFINSNSEAIENAVSRAVELLTINEQNTEKRRTLTRLLNRIDLGVMYINNLDEMEYINLVAQKIFPVYKKVTKIFSGMTEELNKVYTIDNIKIIYNKIPIIVNDNHKGTLITFNEFTNIETAGSIIRVDLLKKGLSAKYDFNDFLTQDKSMNFIKKMANKYAKLEGSVLITGESGTGKELLAQSIHKNSNRNEGPFVAMNCSALPENLLDSELFGYTPGAFTGALKTGKIGLFELAHTGTIFLDEIGELPLNLQSKFLRVLQEHEFRRIGSDEVKSSDFRVISATNVDLLELVEKKKFRADLYYRLNVLRLQTIPLRQRKQDILYLADAFLKKVDQKHLKYIDNLDNELKSFLENHKWQGNVRELENIIQRIALVSDKQELKYNDVKLFLTDIQTTSRMEDTKLRNYLLDGNLEEIKQKIIYEIYKDENHNKSQTAKRLNVDRGTIIRSLSKITKT